MTSPKEVPINKQEVWNLLITPIYQRFKRPSCSWNSFFNCPFCKKYRFRVLLSAYETPFWDDVDINAKCLNCGFTYNKTEVINGYLDGNEDFDPVDFIVGYFNLEVK